jgi:PleD family two-component response regulator
VIARRIVKATDKLHCYSFASRIDIVMSVSSSAGAFLADVTCVTRHRHDSISIKTYDADRAMDMLSPGTMPVILVAEDSSDIRAVLTMLLEDEGYSVVEATDGQASLELALDRGIDLIQLDSAMPRLSGTAFCLAYRDRDGHAPDILITGICSPCRHRRHL